MQATSEINWWLEVAKILSPIAAALILGLWLSRKTEKYKNELAKEINHFQTRDSLLHQKQADVIEQLYSLVSEVEYNLKAISHTLANPDNIEWDMSFLNERLREKLRGLGEASEHLVSFFRKKQILLDKESCTVFNDVHAALLEAERNLSSLFLNEQSGFTLKMTSAQDRWSQSMEIVYQKLPGLKARLDERFREILSPQSKEL